MVKVLVTGAAGFIGFHLSQRLLARGDTVIGIDNLNSYYEVALKQNRLTQLEAHPNFRFYLLDLVDKENVAQVFTQHRFDVAVHLAAQAGVRYSLKNPYAYVDSNLVGFTAILEGCRHTNVGHLVFASSSSVYGANRKVPFSVQDNVDRPVSLYAATKRANEQMAYSYSHLYDIPTTGLRFFTIYGPWGRPDMALFIFTKAILNEQPINVFNYGRMQRDFTYIDDAIEGIVRVMAKIPQPNSLEEAPVGRKTPAPFKIYNIGNNKPVELSRFIAVLEACLGKQAIKNFLPLQPGDVPITYADVSELIKDIDYSPSTSIEVGIERFVTWYKSYYSID